MELLHYRKPTVIVYKIKRWVMIAQSIMLRTKFITLVNLIAAKDIRKNSWRPFDPDAEGADPCVMPEYLSVGDPSAKVSRRIIEWLADDNLREQKVAEMDSLAVQFAIPGATNRAADYILTQMRMESEKSGSTKQTVPDNSKRPSNRQSAA